ncbi:hypothetical protein EV421DRAFT_1738614 [Armillaria borealis]|uniref:Uncharacterized protein n=1 Tax=Armillaria borealis TaxID=47425 RepID=A0AA39MLH6_9AGAR|nr:hypothetical protein EV421DRAFT_1738614 [Armillaria borealis]
MNSDILRDMRVRRVQNWTRRVAYPALTLERWFDQNRRNQRTHLGSGNYSPHSSRRILDAQGEQMGVDYAGVPDNPTEATLRFVCRVGGELWGVRANKESPFRDSPTRVSPWKPLVSLESGIESDFCDSKGGPGGDKLVAAVFVFSSRALVILANLLRIGDVNDSFANTSVGFDGNGDDDVGILAWPLLIVSSLSKNLLSIRREPSSHRKLQIDERRREPIKTATHVLHITEHRQATLIANKRRVARLAIAASKNETGSVVIDKVGWKQAKDEDKQSRRRANVDNKRDPAAFRGPWPRLEGTWITASIGLPVSARRGLDTVQLNFEHRGCWSAKDWLFVDERDVITGKERTHETRNLSTTAIAMDRKRLVGHASGAGGALASKAS